MSSRLGEKERLHSLRSLGGLADANFPKDPEGRVYHLAVKRGEVANRILSVGDPKRAYLLSTLLDDPEGATVIPSKRGFTVYTGRKNNVPVSIIATGMGVPMIDFVVRETRAVVTGPMAILRLGTCGTPSTNVTIGSVSVATKGSVFIHRNPDAFIEGSTEEPYIFSKPVLPNNELSGLLVENMKAHVKTGQVIEGLNATADSFYSSQARIDPNFDDRNRDLLDNLLDDYPVTSLEMETFHLFDLARCSKGTIHASASAIVLAQRKSNDFLDSASLNKLELETGLASLLTLIQFPLGDQVMDEDPTCVWNQKKT